MTDESETGSYRVVCDQCGMRTGRMPKELAERGRESHTHATNHETKIEHVDKP